MGIETSINRISPVETIAANDRKKTDSETIDVRRLSFFDELLSIGQFDMTEAKPIEQSAFPDRDTDRDSAAEGESVKEETDAKTEETTGSEPAAHIAQVTAQQQLVVAPTLEPDKESDNLLNKQVQNQNGEAVAAHTNIKSEVDRPADDVGYRTTTKSNDVKEDWHAAKVDTRTSIEIDPDFQQVEATQESSEVTDTTLPAADSREIKPIQQSKKTSNSSDADPSPYKSSRKSIEPKPKQQQADLRPLSSEKTVSTSQSNVKSETKKQGTDVSDSPILFKKADADASPSLPRNKRAERLAERVSNNDTNTEDGENTSTPQTAIESAQLSQTKEIHTDDESFSFANLPSSNVPSVSSSSAIAIPSANNINATTTTLGTKSESNVVATISSVRSGDSINSSTSSTQSGTTGAAARTDSSRGELARSNAGTRISAYQEVKLVQRVLRGVEQLANGGGQVRLRLHPPELGSLQLSLRMEAGQVFAKLEVENATAKDALMNNVQTLRDRLVEQGMKVGSFEVEVSTDSSGSGAGSSNLQGDAGSSESRWENATSRFAQQNNNRLSSELPQPERKSGAAWIRTNGSLDLTV